MRRTNDFIFIDVEQGSQEWLDFRSGKIGGSDICSIIGENQFETKYACWHRYDQKKQKKKTDAMQHGTETEPIARAWLNEKLGGAPFEPKVLQSIQYPEFIASLDGFRSCGDLVEIAEIKCPKFAKDHLVAASGKVPEKYIPQLNWQMFLANVNRALYCSFFKGEGIIIYVERDDALIDRMIIEANEFLDSLINLCPPPPSSVDCVEFEDYRASIKIARYLEIQKSIKELEEEKEKIKEEIVPIFTHPLCSIGEAKIQLSEIKGSIDYEAMPEDLKKIVEAYRKAPTKSWRISRRTNL